MKNNWNDINYINIYIYIYLDENIINFPWSTLNLSFAKSFPLIETLTNSNSSPSSAKSVKVDKEVDIVDVAVTIVSIGLRSKSNLISDIE